MKNYIKPEMKITLLDNVDVIRTSGETDKPVARSLKTNVNGNEGMNYGRQDVSIYD